MFNSTNVEPLKLIPLRVQKASSKPDVGVRLKVGWQARNHARTRYRKPQRQYSWLRTEQVHILHTIQECVDPSSVWSDDGQARFTATLELYLNVSRIHSATLNCLDLHSSQLNYSNVLDFQRYIGKQLIELSRQRITFNSGSDHILLTTLRQ